MPREVSKPVLRGVAVAASLGVMSLLASCGSGGSDSSTAAAGSAPAGAGQAASPAGVRSFGQEAAPGDRAGATIAVKGFLGALAGHDAARACSLMSASTKRNLAVFTSQLKARGCTGQLEAVRSRLPASALASTAGIQVTGVRVSGGRGFLLYRDAHGTTTAFPIVREGTAWRVAAIAGSKLP